MKVSALKFLFLRRFWKISTSNLSLFALWNCTYKKRSVSNTLTVWIDTKIWFAKPQISLRFSAQVWLIQNHLLKPFRVRNRVNFCGYFLNNIYFLKPFSVKTDLILSFLLTACLSGASNFARRQRSEKKCSSREGSRNFSNTFFSFPIELRLFTSAVENIGPPRHSAKQSFNQKMQWFWNVTHNSMK